MKLAVKLVLIFLLSGTVSCAFTYITMTICIRRRWARERREHDREIAEFLAKLRKMLEKP